MISINHLVIFVGVALSSFVASVPNIAEDVPPLSIQPPNAVSLTHLSPIVISNGGVSTAVEDIDVVRSDTSIAAANNPTHIDWDEHLGAFIHSGGRKVLNLDMLSIIRQFIIDTGVDNCDVIINLPEFDFMSDDQREDLIQDCLDVIEMNLNGGLNAEQAITYLQQQHEMYKAALRTFQNNLLAGSNDTTKKELGTFDNAGYNSSFIKQQYQDDIVIRNYARNPVEVYMVGSGSDDNQKPAAKKAKNEKKRAHHDSKRSGDSEHSGDSKLPANAPKENEDTHDDYSDCEEEGIEDDEPPSTVSNTFTSVYLRNDMNNKKQAAIIKKILKLLHDDLAVPLVKKGKVYVPKSDDEDSNFKCEVRNIEDKSGSLIYYVYCTEKSGRCTSGKQRFKFYVENAKGGRRPNIIYIYDYDCADSEDTDRCKNVLKTIGGLPGVSLDAGIDQLDIDDVKALEEDGLSFFPRLVIDSMIGDINGQVCGVSNIQGYTRAFDLNNLESALQLFLRNCRRGINPNFNTEQHEHLHCNALEWIETADIEVQQKVEEFIKALINHVGDNWMTSINIQNIKFRSSWAPDINCNEASATCVAYDAITGIRNTLSNPDDNCKDMFKRACTGRIPVEEDKDDEDVDEEDEDEGSTKKKKDPYNPEDGYTDTERREVRLEHRKLLQDHKGKSGLIVLDNCNEAYRPSSFKDTDSIGYDADIDADKTLVKMVESEDYEVFFDYKGLVAWVHKHNKSSVIITHPPLCDIFFSSAETEAVSSWRTIQPQGDKAKLAHLLQAIIQYLVTEISEIATNQDVMGNFLFAFAMRIYLVKNLHLHPFVATLFAKNIAWKFDNLFKDMYHRLQAGKGGVNRRQQDKSRNGGDDKDHYIHLDSQSLLSTNGLDIVGDKDTIIGSVVERYTTKAKGSNTGTRRPDNAQGKSVSKLFDNFVKDNGEYGKRIKKEMEDEQVEHNKAIVGGIKKRTQAETDKEDERKQKFGF